MMSMRRPYLEQAGFTLMEMVIGVVLLGILGVVGTTMISASFNTTRVISNEHIAYSSARYAMERMVREIREVQYDTSTSTVGISSISPSQLSFTQSGLGTSRAITINYVAPNVVLTTPDGSAALVSQVSAFNLSYLDVNRQVTAVANNVRFVRISMTISPEQAQALTLLTQVSLRNP